MTTKRDDPPALNGLTIRVLVSLWVLVLAVVIAELLRHARIGGTRFQQADWLINFASGPVRRGFSGEAILILSDVTSVPALYIVALLQACLSLLVAGALLWAFLKAGRPARLGLVMIAPLGLVYWAGDTGSLGRKELLGYLAFLPLLFSRRAPLACWTSVGIFGIAVAFHEGNAFLGPFLVASMAIRSEYLQQITAAGLSTCVIALSGLAFAARFARVTDASPLCARATSDISAADFCDGIIAWMASPMSRNFDVVEQLMSDISPERVLASFVVTLTPFLVAVWHSPYRWMLFFGCALGLLIFVPAYILAKDWGRWMSMACFGLTFLLATGAIWRPSQAAFLHKPVSLGFLALATVAALTVAPIHYSGEISTGLIATLHSLFGS